MKGCSRSRWNQPKKHFSLQPDSHAAEMLRGCRGNTARGTLTSDPQVSDVTSSHQASATAGNTDKWMAGLTSRAPIVTVFLLPDKMTSE